MAKKYVLLKDRFNHKAGTEVFEYRGYDYGQVSDIEFKAVIINLDNSTSFFTIPIKDLKEIQTTIGE